MVVERLSIDGIPAMRALRRRALASDRPAFGVTAEDDMALEPEVTRSPEDPSRAAIFVALASGAPIGMVGLLRQAREKIKHRAVVWGMFVEPADRGRGLAPRLLDAGVRHARTWDGVLQVHLSVTSASPAARRVYERAGFVVWGREPRALARGGELVDEHHLVLPLGGS